MHRASVLLFPENGGTPLEYRLEGNLTHKEIKVPVGTYSVVAFNETTDPDDWKGITFTGKDSYNDFAAVSKPIASRGFYTRSDGLNLIENPDVLAAWSLDSFEVTEEMITTTRATDGSQTVVSDLTNIIPTPRTERMRIAARVGNLSSAMQATGVLDDMASGVYLVSGEKLPATGDFAFILNERVYDSDGDDGTTTSVFNIFGRRADPSVHTDMYIDFLLNDGTLFPRQTFDAEPMMVHVPTGIQPVTSIDVGLSDTAPDHLIILPEMDVESGVVVDDWDEVVVPIK
jgi:hypothetical protein